MRPSHAPERPSATLHSKKSAAILFCLAVLPVAPGCLRERSPVAPSVRADASGAAPTLHAPPDVSPVRDASPDVSADVSADVSPDVAPDVSPDESPDPTEPPRAYADPRALDALAGDPAWRMPTPDNPDDGWTCESNIHPQSCEPDPCFEGVGQRCRDACGRRCRGDERACRRAAVACRAPCVDGACRRQCAVVEARCLDAVVEAKDRCASSGCQPTIDACFAVVSARFRRTCRAVCAACTEQCASLDDGFSCFEACFRAHRGCDRVQQSACVMAGPEWGDVRSDSP